MNLEIKHLFFLALTFMTLNVSAEKAILKGGTFIPVRLAQNINGNINSQGETIFFEVLENIKVNGLIVVDKGTFVKGKITNAESRKSLGKAGKLSLEARNLNAVDGSLIEVVREPMSSEGRKRTGATVAHVIMWGPLGLFAKGRAARVMLDTEYDIEVRSDIEINVEEKTVREPVKTSSFEAYFPKHSGKINFAKGKIGKDFKLNIKLPETTNLDRRNISITSALDYKLPKPIYPVALSWDKKQSAFVVVFPFKEIVKYIAPGISNITVEANIDNISSVAETTLKTKWKMK